MPGASARESLAPEAADGGKGQEEEEDKQDDRLWCICKTKWDNDSVMIGCDSCEDWYHPRCVNMPEHLMDLVDQYFCPNCVSNDRSKRTTWKRRCLYGLSQPNPSSAKACHRPTRAENSKFCSDECGVKHMKARIDSWADKGGNKDLLWDSVKTAPKRQGVVMLAPSTDEARPPLVATIGVTKKDEKGGLPPRERYDPAPAPTIIKPEKTPVAREIERLNARIEGLVEKREALRKEMDLIVWREKLLELASSRSEHVDECAWDQRLCFGDEECVEYGAGVLESYEEPAAGGARDNGADAMQAEEDGQWWCRGKKKCDRHAGWQKLRAQDIEKEKDLKNSLLANLAKMERAIRKRIEDLAAPQVHRTVPEPASPVGDVENKPSAARAHGHSKPKTNGQASKRGKKRKAD